MKFEDLMLDMATGDASMHDAYIQESVGKINVSAAIFDTARKISELPEGEFLVVQEAAEAGLPTDQAGATCVACEAVKQSTTALYDLVSNTAKKLKAASEKDMKALIAIGKTLGVPTDGDFKGSFVPALIKAILGSEKKLSLPDKRFLKGKYAEAIAECYGSCMANFLSAFGISMSFGDYRSRKEVRTFKDVKKNVCAGAKQANFDKTVNKDQHYTDSVSASDIEALAEAIYDVMNVSKAVVDATAGGAKKNALTMVNTLCDKEDCNGHFVTRALEGIVEGVKEASANLTAITDNTTKAFTDSVYALSSKMTGNNK